jgi:histone-lysine N-methyltransferase SETD2
LRADTDLQPNDFVFEYVGEVINEPTFRNRMVKYDKEGIKHFYFMSLTKSEFVDATKKGNLGRFCNHSCNPNCYVDKWVVGEKLRMGIFTARTIRAGEELVFNYNVDRYGADPQPCYCGEPNCVGFIGGKTQTERATKLPLATIEALGIDDGDSWDTAVAKKPRKKKAAEDDEEYVNSVQPRALDEDGVNKVMATLMQCKEKWIAVKLLSRLQATEDEHLRHRVVRMHGYQILKSTLNTFKDDTNVVLQLLDILDQLPRITKNKISDSNIEGAVQPLTSSAHEEVAAAAKRLIDAWGKLETAYRIPRKKHDRTAPIAVNSFEERRNKDRDEPAKPADPFANVVIPTGPRSNIPQRNTNFFPGQRPPRKLPTNLPDGWFVTTDQTGRYYFYDGNGKTQWQRPTTPAVETPKASSKAHQDQKTLQNIIDSLTKEPTPRHSAGHTPQRSSTPTTEPKKEKWRSLPMDKQMKIYENTVSFHFDCVPIASMLTHPSSSPM